LLLEHSDAGEESVGMDISLRHLAPTLLDMQVEITATVVAVEGRKVMFEVAANDEIEPIATSTHTRFVVDVAKRYERLKAKAAKRAAARAG
jgi:fluoroacetyl-CoA thioesterase